MHYVPDTSGIRDKREKIAELQEDAEIAKLEKKKDLIQDEIDALEEQKDLIRDMIEESNKYYDNLIKQTEKSIKELSKNAEDASKAAGNAAGNVGGAINKLRDTLNTGKTLSYYIWTVQDEEVLANAKAGLENLNTLLEKNPENSHYAQLKDDVTNFVNELEKLKETRLVTDDFTNSLNTLKNSEDEYLKLFQDALAGVEERVGNTANYSDQILGFVSPIADKTGELKQTLQTANEEVRNLGANTSDVVNGISTSVDGTNENINRLTGTVADAVMKVNNDSELLDGSVTNLSDAVTRATESTSIGFNNLATDMSNTTASISQNADTVNNVLDSMADGERFDNLTGSFNSLGEAILGVSMALGISEEGTVGGLVSALTAINEISLGGEEGGIIGQFHNLKSAVDEVSAAIAGGGSEGSASSGKSSASGSSTGSNKGTGSKSGNGADSVTGALEQLLQTADKTIGNGDKSGFSDDGDTVIGKFGILKTAVNAVTEAIGLEEGAEGDEDLISALMAEFNTANEVLPQEEQLFNELEASIQACVSALRAMIEALREIDSIGVPGVGGGSAHAKGTVGSAFAEGTVGKAFAKGYNGLPKDEKNALRSEYGQPELTLYPDGTTELTNQPIMSDLPKGTIIFNEEQTKKILNGEPAMRGKVYPTGAIEFENGTIARPNGEILTPLPDDAPFMIAQKKFEAYVQKMGSGIETVLDAALTSMMNERNKEMDKVINQLNAGNVITNNKNIQPSINVGDIHVTCPGVTSQEVMRHLGTALDEKFNGFSTYTDQWSRT